MNRGGLSSAEVLARLDGRVSYRQLDYWVRTGRIRPSYREARGSGSGRRWSPSDVDALEQIAALIERHDDEAAKLATGQMWRELHRGLRFGYEVEPARTAQASAVA